MSPRLEEIREALRRTAREADWLEQMAKNMLHLEEIQQKYVAIPSDPFTYQLKRIADALETLSYCVRGEYEPGLRILKDE